MSKVVPNTNNSIIGLLDTFLNIAEDLQLGNFDESFDMIQIVLPFLTSQRSTFKKLYFGVQDQISVTNESLTILQREVGIIASLSAQLKQTSLFDVRTRARLSWQITQQLVSIPVKINSLLDFNSSSAVDIAETTQVKLLEYNVEDMEDLMATQLSKKLEDIPDSQ